MKYVRIVDGRAAEVFVPPSGFSIANCFHADVAAQFVPCPSNVVPGSTLSGQTWTLPIGADPTSEPATVLPSMTPMAFYLAFSPAERIAIKASADAEVQEFWATFQLALQTSTPIDPNLPSVATGLAVLRAKGILASDDRIAHIKSGTPQ